METPYITKTRTVVDRFYNPNYGDDRICQCGHPYYRHFDTYEDMAPVGCKYCFCGNFEEFTGDINAVIEQVKTELPEEYEELILTKEKNNFPDAWLNENCIELIFNLRNVNGEMGQET